MLQISVSTYQRPIQSPPEKHFCGDAALVIEKEDKLYLVLFDGAGHGFSAYKVAQISMAFIKERLNEALSELLLALHQTLRGTIGGVASICCINKKTGELIHSGIGNITARLWNPKSHHFVTRGGVLGHEIVSPVIDKVKLQPGNIFMLYSDGVMDRLTSSDIPDFFKLSAEDIARITINSFSKEIDDASCIVLKVENDRVNESKN